jgi:hypothetical protein
MLHKKAAFRATLFYSLDITLTNYLHCEIGGMESDYITLWHIGDKTSTNKNQIF